MISSHGDCPMLVKMRVIRLSHLIESEEHEKFSVNLAGARLTGVGETEETELQQMLKGPQGVV